MTFKEAKKEIEKLSDEYWHGYKGYADEHPEWRGDPKYEAKADALDEALAILDEVEE